MCLYTECPEFCDKMRKDIIHVEIKKNITWSLIEMLYL